MIRLQPVIPSILSAMRIIIAVAFPFSPERFWLWLLLTAGISDVLDGWLARRWGVVSWQGGLIDAIADKLFVLTVLIVYAVSGKFSPYWIPIVISRDLTVLFTALYIAGTGLWGSFKKMDARVPGKIATGGQFTLFVTVLIAPQLTLFALIFCSLCNLLAATDYGLLFIRALARRRQEGTSG